MQDVQKSLGQRPVLRDVTWSVPQGCVCGLIGANGAGKTTLLRLALGLVWPDAGTVRVLGERLGRENAALRQRVQYVASDRTLPLGLRVGDWLHYASLAYPHWDRARARRLGIALELPPGRSVRELSAGERTSLQIVAAAASHPELLLLDEATNGLDLVVKSQVLGLLIDMAAAEGTTIVVASHHIEDIERLSDRLAVLHAGRIVREGELDAIKASVHRLQVVMPGDWPAALDADPRVIAVERTGKVALVTVEGPAEPVATAYRAAGAILVEPVDLDLGEVFRIVLEREGYGRAELRWNAS